MSLLAPSWRRFLISLLIAAPAMAGALVFTIVEADQARQRAAIRDKPSGSFAEAICDDRVEDAYRFIRAGADPNAPISFREGEITGDREVMVSPLMLAVACRRENTTIMLLGFGARLDAPANQYALCLARDVTFEQFPSLLERNGTATPTVDCPVAGDGLPLLAYLR